MPEWASAAFGWDDDDTDSAAAAIAKHERAMATRKEYKRLSALIEPHQIFDVQREIEIALRKDPNGPYLRWMPFWEIVQRHGISHANAKQIYALIDQNSDGAIELHEVQSVLTALESANAWARYCPTCNFDNVCSYCVKCTACPVCTDSMWCPKHWEGHPARGLMGVGDGSSSSYYGHASSQHQPPPQQQQRPRWQEQHDQQDEPQSAAVSSSIEPTAADLKQERRNKAKQVEKARERDGQNGGGGGGGGGGGTARQRMNGAASSSSSSSWSPRKEMPHEKLHTPAARLTDCLEEAMEERLRLEAAAAGGR